MKEYRVFIVPKEIIAYGENKDEAIKNVLKLLENYKEMFVVEEVDDNGED